MVETEGMGVAVKARLMAVARDLARKGEQRKGLAWRVKRALTVEC